MAHEKIALLGVTGNIGEDLLRQMSEKDADTRKIIAMAHRDGIVFNPNGIGIQYEPTLIAELQRRDIDLAREGRPRTALKEYLRNEKGYQDGANLQDLLDQLTAQGLIQDTVIVDVTASDSTDIHQRAIESGGRVVTANKIPAAQCSLDVFRILTENRQKYGYNCSVMAGAPAVQTLRDRFDSKDTVESIEGCFSGTLGKLCNLLHEGDITFSEAVKQLKEAGDTEPDPRDDLSGMDVAKKIVILARTAGYNVDLKDVQIDPFIPGGFGELTDVSTKEFMAKADIFDKEIAAKFSEAKAQGKTLRYVASLKIEDGKPVVRLGLREEALDSELGSLKGNGNKVVIYTSEYKKVPCVISAPGSGTSLTAGNVRANISQQAQRV